MRAGDEAYVCSVQNGAIAEVWGTVEKRDLWRDSGWAVVFNRVDLTGSAADALLPLILCEQDLYQRLVQEFIDKQPIDSLRTRLAKAFHSLTSSNKLSSSLDRPNRHRFRKNFHEFLTEISGLRIM